MSKKIPFLLNILAVFFIFASLACLLGLVQTVQSWNWLQAAGYQPGPVYNVFENSFLFLAFLASAVFLWIRFSWAPTFGQLVALVSAVWFWMDRIFLSQSAFIMKEQTLPLVLTAFALFFVLFSLYLLQPYMKSRLSANLPVENSGDHDENTPS